MKIHHCLAVQFPLRRGRKERESKCREEKKKGPYSFGKLLRALCLSYSCNGFLARWQILTLPFSLFFAPLLDTPAGVSHSRVQAQLRPFSFVTRRLRKIWIMWRAKFSRNRKRGKRAWECLPLSLFLGLGLISCLHRSLSPSFPSFSNNF